MKEQWTIEQANEWYSKKPWIVGCNYVPAITLHAQELWQEDTHDTVLKEVEKEMKLMTDIGFNSVRMFMPFWTWYHKRDVFLDRVDSFLNILDSRGITMCPVIHNDCLPFLPKPEKIDIPPLPKGWHKYKIGHHGGCEANPFTGEPVKYGWSMWDFPEWHETLIQIVVDFLTRFKDDKRIIMWDLWNEPGNSNRYEMDNDNIKRVFEAAWKCDTSQPLTAGCWGYHEAYREDDDENIYGSQKVGIELSDVISYHFYGNKHDLENITNKLKKYNRPMFNTEWLNRSLDNFVEDNLPLYYENKIGSYHWGLVAGKSQFNLPWDYLRKDPNIDQGRWQHDLFDVFGTAYDQKEIDLIKKYIEKGRKRYGIESGI